MDEWMLNDLLECSVCLERLDTSSKVLPCQHTFCKKCLEEILLTHKELRCPECRVLVDVKIDDLPPNVLLMRILEGMRNAAPKKRNSGGGGSSSVQHTPSRLPMVSGGQQPSSLPIMHHHHHQHHLMASHISSSSVIQPPCVPSSLASKTAIPYYPQPPSLATVTSNPMISSQIPMSHNHPFLHHSLHNSSQSSYIRLDQSITPLCTTAVSSASNSESVARHDQLFSSQPTSVIVSTSSSLQNYPSSSDPSSVLPPSSSVSSSAVMSSPNNYTLSSLHHHHHHHHGTPPPPPPASSSVSSTVSNLVDNNTSTSRSSSVTISQPSHNHNHNHNLPVSVVAGQEPSSRLPIHVPNKVTGQPCARAVYDYLSKMPGDLSFKEGDLIILRRKIDNNWYHGECRGNMGVFPLSYVQIMTPLPNHIPQCKALYDFRMTNDDEEGCLTFNKGEVITVIRRVDENWAEGKLGDRIGIFPLAFVELNSVGRALMKLSTNCQPGPSRVAPPTPTTEDATPLIPTDHTRTVATTHSSNTQHSAGSDSSSSTTLTSPSSSSSSSTTPPTSSSSTAPSSPTSPPQPPNSNASHVLSHPHHKRHSFTALQQPTQSQNSHRHSAEILSTSDNSGQDISTSGPQSLQLNSTTNSSSHTEVNQSCGLQRSGSQRHHRSASSEAVPPPPPPPPHPTPHTHHTLQLPASYVALYPYKPQKSDELELKRGNVYTVTERCQDGWFKGTNKNQKCGVFPGNYVAPARSLPALQAQLRGLGLGRTAIGSGSPRNNQTPMPSPEPRSYTRQSATARHLSAGAGGTNPPELPPRSISPGGGTCMPSSWHGDMSGVSSNRTHAPLMTTSGPAGGVSKADGNTPGRNSPITVSTAVVGPPNVSVTVSSSSSSLTLSAGKSSEKSKEKKDRSGGGVSIMKRSFFSMKKSKSPPPATYSMDNPVFEDGTGTTSTTSCAPPSVAVSPHPVHVRSGSCPSQLLQVLPVDAISGLNTSTTSPHHTTTTSSHSHHHRLFSPSTSQRLKHKERPNINLAQFSRSGDGGSPIPGSAAHHRKSNSLDSGAVVGGTISDPRKPKQLVPVVKERFRCIVPYPPNSEYELELQVGDVIYVHKKREDGWYKGTQQRTGRTGLFPASFVETF
ncbi:SH3 domain containing ring finger posh [Lycorma delicatula]|uniref:SH3 domain containing ring finger posh n=1 Tax=Lycorma delicatula TaxID=130591 RepID=UPI003F50F3FF